MSEPSKTPRTDAATFDLEVVGDAYTKRRAYPDGSGDFVESDVSKQLEKELAAMTAERDEYRAKAWGSEEELRHAIDQLADFGEALRKIALDEHVSEIHSNPSANPRCIAAQALKL